MKRKKKAAKRASRNANDHSNTGHICKKECLSCPDTESYRCYRAAKTCYIYFCNTRSCPVARRQCQSIYARLAEIADDRVATPPFNVPCNAFYVDLGNHNCGIRETTNHIITSHNRRDNFEAITFRPDPTYLSYHFEKEQPTTIGYICAVECRICDEKRTYTCHRIGDICYTYYCGISTCRQAIRHCIILGGTLGTRFMDFQDWPNLDCTSFFVRGGNRLCDLMSIDQDTKFRRKTRGEMDDSNEEQITHEDQEERRRELEMTKFDSEVLPTSPWSGGDRPQKGTPFWKGNTSHFASRSPAVHENNSSIRYPTSGFVEGPTIGIAIALLGVGGIFFPLLILALIYCLVFHKKRIRGTRRLEYDAVGRNGLLRNGKECMK